MKTGLLLFVCLSTFIGTAFGHEYVSTTANKNEIKTISISSEITEIKFSLAGFYKSEVNTQKGKAFVITAKNATQLLRSGAPDLPKFALSLVIPDTKEMQVEVLTSSFVDYPIEVAPSKGNLYRNIDPSTVPFSFGPEYTTDQFFPQSLSFLRAPYILRDFRGETVVIQPFQYNASTKTLRVFTNISFRVLPTGNPGTVNVLNRTSLPHQLDPSFFDIYKNHFANFAPTTYTPLNEHGRMLVIAPTQFLSDMQPFIDWKNRMGQRTEMIDVSTIGIDPALIKNYILNYYQTYGLSYVLLVGDGPQIPPFPDAYGDSDPSYGFLSGNDYYAEVFVGRFSANTSEELITQVNRSINYERNPDPAGQWYHKGICIGSDQGPGDDNEFDYEHERNMRTDLLGYFYSDVDELYDGTQGIVDMIGNPTPQDLATVMNDGRSIVNYTGHGSQTSIGTTSFDMIDLPLLTNNNMLPFVWSVACVNGDFNLGTCLAEGLMREHATSGEARGAIATFMSTINQSWNPPMDGQDEMVDILVELYSGNIKHCIGAISENGCMHMNDQYAAAGDEMTATWTVFGDPSLTVRTNTPQPLNVTASTSIDPNASTFIVNTGMDFSLACLSHNNSIVSSAWSLGGVVNLPINGLTIGDTLELTVTAYNSIPYTSQVIVTSPTSVSQISFPGKFSVYPNPFTCQTTLSFDLYQINVNLKVTDLMGTEIMHEKISGYQYTLEKGRMSAGVYLLSIEDQYQNCVLQKLIIQ